MPSEFLAKAKWATLFLHPTNLPHRKEFGLKDADRPHCFIRNLGAFLIAARKLPPQPGAGLYLKWGAAPSGAHTHRAVTVSRAHRAEGCGNARFPTRDGLQRGTGFAASSSQPSAHLSAGGLGAPRHGEERSREGRAARGRRRVASPPRGALPAHARPAPPPRAAPRRAQAAAGPAPPPSP